ncbi:uncharacterized protein LOC106170869 [Lingula anatina]|uniref:Annexin n=1 Tax=Lingula anatina TaxID=7574 RepID=A0A1S3J7N3_LINAN|nr:uncharacterized protein LOC106170869 [Lingula anatina]|eukprot:XP_013406318.1 uncharacterized protein LOC106170869 [Lingula anatina]
MPLTSGLAMPRQGPGFAVPSKLLQKKWEDRKYKSHMDKMHSMKSGLDTTPPKKQPHLTLRLKKVQLEEDRQAKIDNDNELLLQKMSWIMTSRGRLDNWNDYESKRDKILHLNRGMRDREQQKIANENIRIAKSLNEVKPVYNIGKWEEEDKKHNYLLGMINHTTKDYAPGLTPRKSPRRSLEEESVAGSDFPSSRATSRRTHSKQDSLKESSVPKLPRLTGEAKEKVDSPVEEDAKLLFRAIKGLENGDEVMIKTMLRRTCGHRNIVKNKFRANYDLDLEGELKALMGSAYYLMIDVLLTEQDAADAETLNKRIATKDVGGVVEMMVMRSNAELSALRETYRKKYDKTVEEDIKDSFDKHVQLFLLTLSKEGRNESEAVDDDLALNDANELHELTVVSFGENTASYIEMSADQQSGDGRWLNDNGKFMKLLGERSLHQIRATLHAYKNVTGEKDLTDTVASDCGDTDFTTAVKTLATLLRTPHAFYVERLHDQMSHKDPEFIRMLLDRADVDMPAIRKLYKKKYSVELVDDIKYRCKGEAVKLLLELATRLTPHGKAALAKFRKFAMVATAAVPQKKIPHSKRGADHKKESSIKGNPPHGKSTKDHNKSKKEHVDKGHKDKKNQSGSPNSKAGSDHRGTVHPYENFDVLKDVEAIREAVAGFGTDEKPLIDILSSRSNEQRQQIRKKYQEKYKKNLIEELNWELTGDLEEVVQGLLQTPIEFDTFCLHDAVEGLGTREAVLIGILATRSPKQLHAIKAQYKKAYGKELSSVIADDTSGGFQTLLLELLEAERDQSNKVDQTLAEKDAALLYKEAESTLDLSDANFRNVLTKRSRAQVRATFAAYKKLAGHDITEGIKKAMVGDAEEGYIALGEHCFEIIEGYIALGEHCKQQPHSHADCHVGAIEDIVVAWPHSGPQQAADS